MKAKAKIASRFMRFKAFLIDIFLIYTPILYICYFTLGSKQAFLENHLVIFLCSLFFGLIQALFLSFRAQSPGLRAYELYLIDSKKGNKLGFLRIMLRYVVFLFGCAFLFGLVMSFFRKDGFMFHDILTRSCIVSKI